MGGGGVDLRGFTVLHSLHCTYVHSRHITHIYTYFLQWNLLSTYVRSLHGGDTQNQYLLQYQGYLLSGLVYFVLLTLAWSLCTVFTVQWHVATPFVQ